LRTGEYIEIISPLDVRYIAINNGVDTFKSENKLMSVKNIFNNWFAWDTSRKMRAVFKAKGNTGKSLATVSRMGIAGPKEYDRKRKAA